MNKLSRSREKEQSTYSGGNRADEEALPQPDSHGHGVSAQETDTAGSDGSDGEELPCILDRFVLIGGDNAMSFHFSQRATIEVTGTHSITLASLDSTCFSLPS